MCSLSRVYSWEQDKVPCSFGVFIREQGRGQNDLMCRKCLACAWNLIRGQLILAIISYDPKLYLFICLPHSHLHVLPQAIPFAYEENPLQVLSNFCPIKIYDEEFTHMLM